MFFGGSVLACFFFCSLVMGCMSSRCFSNILLPVKEQKFFLVNSCVFPYAELTSFLLDRYNNSKHVDERHRHRYEVSISLYLLH